VREQLDPDGQIEWSFIERWPTHPGFIKTFAKNVQAELDRFPAEDRDDVVVLFSAHSLPMTVINQGDPYPAEIGATAYAIMKELGFRNPYRVVYQSQVGPQPWLGAQTSKVVEELDKRESNKGVVIVPVAFTSDHIETLHEVDIEMKENLKRPELVRRAESLNGDPMFIQALADILQDHLQGNVENQVESGAAIRHYILRI
jgi:ferrochelatase